MASHEQRFWSETERYHDLVKEFEMNVDTYRPDYFTGRVQSCPLYQEHRGESLK